MKCLLDTHLLLWAATDSPKLPIPMRREILDERNDLIFSAASIWEIAIKSSLGRSDFLIDPLVFRRELLDHG